MEGPTETTLNVATSLAVLGNGGKCALMLPNSELFCNRESSADAHSGLTLQPARGDHGAQVRHRVDRHQ